VSVCTAQHGPNSNPNCDTADVYVLLNTALTLTLTVTQQTCSADDSNVVQLYFVSAVIDVTRSSVNKLLFVLMMPNCCHSMRSSALDQVYFITCKDMFGQFELNVEHRYCVQTKENKVMLEELCRACM